MGMMNLTINGHVIHDVVYSSRFALNFSGVQNEV